MNLKYKGLYEKVGREIQDAGIVVKRQQYGFYVPNKDIVPQHPYVIFCHQGSCRVLYDMREITFGKNELAIIMPGHVLNQLDCTDDFIYSYMVVSIDLFREINTHIIGDDTNQFVKHPIIYLSDERVKILLKIADMLIYIASFNDQNIHMRHQLLKAQLFVGCEFIYSQYRRQEQQKGISAHTALYYHFCSLVIKHYRESREVKYYADLLHLTPKHFTKIIRQEMNISPVEWIEQYVVSQAKMLIEIYPNRTLGEIAYMLGFSEPTSFYRYFKRITGTTAKQFRERL